MATRPVYSATIKFDFDTKGLAESVKKIQGIVKSSVQDIGQMTSGIKLDIPSLEKIGPLGGLSSIGDKLARQIRSQVKMAFEGLGDEIEPKDVERALESVADTFGTTSKAILARMARLKGGIGDAFREIKETGIDESQALYDALIRHSIFTDMFRDIVSGFIKMKDSVVDTITDMASSVRGQSESLGEIDISSDALSLMISLLEKLSQVVKSTTSGVSSLFDGISKSIQNAAETIRGIIDIVLELERRFSSAKAVLVAFSKSSRDASSDVSGIAPSVTKVTSSIADAGRVIKETSGSVGGFKEALKSAFKVNAEKDVDSIRETVAKLEETLTRLPDKSSASFNLIKRNFGEVRAEAIRMQKQIDAGVTIDDAIVANTVSQLDKIGKKITDFKTEELVRLREELNRNSDAVSLTSRSFVDKLKDVRDGISLASETGENKLLSLRLAMFGVGEATGPVSKLLDRFTSNVDDVGIAEGRLVEVTSRATQSLSSQQSAIKGSIDVIKKIAQAEGLHASALNDLDKQVNDVQNAYEAMTSTIEATGKATPQQVARVRDEYRLLEQSIELVKEQNKDAIGPDTLKAFGALEKRIKSNVPATRVLAATLDQAAQSVARAKSEAKEFGSTTARNTGIFHRFADMLESVGGFISQEVRGLKTLNIQIRDVSLFSKSAGASLIGAFGDVLLRNIHAVSAGLSGLVESVGTKVVESTALIQRSFDLLPQEAEVVSSVIYNVYENNLGGSIEEIGEATQRAIARFRDLGVTSEEEISGVVSDAFRLSDTYKFDVPESLDAAAVLMKSFNLTTKESTDFLTGLGKAGIIGSDAIDSILEYSTQVQSAGGNADNLFNIIKTGFAGGGALGTDKAVDLFKEFRILISEGSDDVKDALNKIGINSTELMAQLSGGTMSVTEAFDFVNEKLGQLDNQTEITKLGAAIMGTQFEDMGNQMALAIRTTGTSMADLSGASDSLVAKYTDLGSGISAVNRSLEVTFTPLKDAFLSLAMQAIPPIMSALESLRPLIENIAAKVNFLFSAIATQDWGSATGIITDAFATATEGIVVALDWLTSYGFDWGANFVIEIANGLIETASSVIADAMNYIGDMMSSFLAPGSPPEKGPLSNIDKWGKGLVDTFGESFSSADFKFVEDATKPIEEHFAKTFGKGGFEAFEGVRDKFTEIVAEINKTGIIDETKFKEIEGAIGGANTELTKMLKVQLKLKSAEQALASIQEEATAAQSAGFVSEGLKKKLKAAKTEVTTAKENVEWQKEFLKFQGLSEDKFGGMARSAAKMGGAASAGAAKATRAIKGAVDRQLEFIESGFHKEEALLKQKFDAGIISEKQYIADIIKLEEKFVDAKLDRGLLSGKELSLWGERINKLKASLDEIKGTSKGIVPIGESLFGDVGAGIDAEDITGDVGKNLLTSAKDLGSSFSNNLADGLLESARTRLSSAFSDIGTSISKLFKEKILDKLTPAQKETGGIIGSALLGIGVSATITKIGLVASKIGMLSSFALRLSVIGTAIWLIWKNWDKILAGINIAVAYMTELWGDFTEKLGGSEEALKLFSDIFTGVKDTLIEIGTSLKDFVLDALAGESISFSDFIAIFDVSGIDTSAITKVVEAFMSTFQEQVDKIKLSIGFGEEGGAARIGGEMEGADPTRFEKIAANFTRIFNNIRDSVNEFTTDVQTAFSEFAESDLGVQIANLINAITESWGALTAVAGGALFTVYLPTILTYLGRFTPLLGSVSSVLGRIIPIVGIATVFIGNFEKIWPPLETALAGAVLAVTGIVEAIGGIWLMFDDETRAEGVQLFFGGLTDAIGGLQETFLGLGITIANFFISAAADVSGGIATLLESFGLVSDPFRDLETALDSLPEKLNTMLDDAITIMRNLRFQMKVILFLAARNFTEWVKGIWESVTGWFTKLWDDLVGHSIITDMVSDIVSALSMEEAIKKVQLVVTSIKLAFFRVKAYVSTQMSLLAIAINSKFSAMSTFVSGKITTLKGFVEDVKTFISDTVTAISGFKLPTLTEIATSTAGVITSLAELAEIDISAGVTSITDSLSTLATDGVASVKAFTTDTLETITGIDMSKEVDTMFAPVETALAAIAEFDAVAAFSTMFEGVDISTVIGTIFDPVQKAIDAIGEFSFSDIFSGTEAGGEVEPLFGIESLGIPTKEEIATAMTDFTTGVATPIANLGLTIGTETSAIAESILGIVAEVDTTNIFTLVTSVAALISALGVTINAKVLEIWTSISDMFVGVDLETAVSDISTTVTTGIGTMVTDGIEAISGFATDFVDYILGIPARIKEKISDFTDIGSLLAGAFGGGDDAEEIAGGISDTFAEEEGKTVGIVEKTTQGLTDAWDAAADYLVWGSVVPDLVTGINEQFALLSTTAVPIATAMTLSIQNAFLRMSISVIQSMSNMGLVIQTSTFGSNSAIASGYLILTQTVNMHMQNMQTDVTGTLNTIQPAWLTSFRMMTDSLKLFGDVGKRVFDSLDAAVRKLTASVRQLKERVDEAVVAIEELADIDLGDLVDAFENMRDMVKKAKNDAEKFMKFMEAARDAAADIGDTLGGNTAGGGSAPGAQHGAWRVPKNQMMFLHEGETVLPPEVASNFRRLMVVLQEAGIGGRSFGFQMGTPQAGKPTTGGPTIVNIYPNFPNVTSAQEAGGIETELNKLIDDARKYSAVGGQS